MIQFIKDRYPLPYRILASLWVLAFGLLLFLIIPNIPPIRAYLELYFSGQPSAFVLVLAQCLLIVEFARLGCYLTARLYTARHSQDAAG